MPSSRSRQHRRVNFLGLPDLSPLPAPCDAPSHRERLGAELDNRSGVRDVGSRRPPEREKATWANIYRIDRNDVASQPFRGQASLGPWLVLPPRNTDLSE
jgi:hypothetical protein